VTAINYLTAAQRFRLSWICGGNGSVSVSLRRVACGHAPYL